MTFYLHGSSFFGQNRVPMQVKLLFPIKKNKVSTYLSFTRFFIVFGPFWRPWGPFWHSFGAFVVSFGVLVSSFWVPLARLGCLWALSATFCGAFGSSGLSVGSETAPGLFFGSCSKLFPCFFNCFFICQRGRRPLQ